MGGTISQIKHGDKTIILIDYTKCSKSELIRRTEEVMAWMKKQPKGSLLTISDFEGQIFDKETVEAFKNLALNNKPYVKAGALIGVTGLQKIAYNVIMKFSGRNMPAFNTRDEAMDWLVKQEG